MDPQLLGDYGNSDRPVPVNPASTCLTECVEATFAAVGPGTQQRTLGPSRSSADGKPLRGLRPGLLYALWAWRCFSSLISKGRPGCGRITGRIWGWRWPAMTHCSPMLLSRRAGRCSSTPATASAAVFSTVSPAIEAAAAAQRALRAQEWGTIRAIRVRMAIHAGEADRQRRGLVRSSVEPHRPADGDRLRRAGAPFRARPMNWFQMTCSRVRRSSIWVLIVCGI